MYHEFFGLAREPFSMTPDPGFLFLTAKHREALAGLVFAITSRKGFLVLTGDAGTGKTTLLSRVMGSMPPERAHFSYILNPTLSPNEFLEMVMLDFGFETIPESKSQRLIRLQQFLLKGHAEGRTLVLVVDEAQKLTPELLEEIRLLTNFETSDHKLLQIILAGQTELTDLLNRQELRQLKQRVAVRVGIEPLAAQEVGQYIRTRWSRAGAVGDPPFSPSAIQMIASYSRGIPRVINSICDNALMNAFGVEARIVEDKYVLEAVHDLQLSTNGQLESRGYTGEGLSRAAMRTFADPSPQPRPVPAKAPPAEKELPPISFKTLERYMPAPTKPGWQIRFRAPRG